MCEQCSAKNVYWITSYAEAGAFARRASSRITLAWKLASLASPAAFLALKLFPRPAMLSSAPVLSAPVLSNADSSLGRASNPPCATAAFFKL